MTRDMTTIMETVQNFLRRYTGKVLLVILLSVALANQVAFHVANLEHPKFPLHFLFLDWVTWPWLLRAPLSWWIGSLAVSAVVHIVPNLWPGRSWIWRLISSGLAFWLLFMYKPVI